MKFSELIDRVTGKGVVVTGRHGGGADPEITGVCEDSRKVKPGDLFVARAGVKLDGGKFTEAAIAGGAVAVVLENSKLKTQSAKASGEGLENVPWVGVEDANLACALVAHEVAGHPTSAMKVIGVTGTKGKTTVAYLLRSVLKAAGHKVGMIGTVEIDDGCEAVPADMTTPGSVELVALFSRMKANGVSHCVMEVSSHALHQHRVAGIDFVVGIFTNLTGDHLDYHKTMEEYAASKAMLFDGLKERAVAVVNGDDAWTEKIISRCKVPCINYCIGGARKQFGKPFWAVDELIVGIGRMTSEGMRLLASNGEAIFNLSTPLVGRHNAYNLASVFVTADVLGLDLHKVACTLMEATGAPGRLQRVTMNETALPFQVFVDYAHTHDSLENVLKALRATMGKGKLLCVFGCGGDRDRTKRPKMGAVAEKLADRVIVTSDNPRTEDPKFILNEICTGFSSGWKDNGKITVDADRRSAIRQAIAMASREDVVLIAGKGHENYQIIGTTKHHFDDVEEAQACLAERMSAEVGR